MIFGFIHEDKNHWTCCYIDLNSNKMFYINPKGEDQEQKLKYFENWM